LARNKQSIVLVIGTFNAPSVGVYVNYAHLNLNTLLIYLDCCSFNHKVVSHRVSKTEKNPDCPSFVETDKKEDKDSTSGINHRERASSHQPFRYSHHD